jgi:hypothetical protein
LQILCLSGDRGAAFAASPPCTIRNDEN